MGAENAVETAIYSALTGAATLTAQLAGTTSVYNGVAHEDAALPFVVFSLQSGVMESVDPNRREALLYQVQAVSENSMGQAGSIDGTVDALLDGTALSVTGYTTIWCRRESTVRYVETDAAGKRYYHSAGVYRIRLT